MPINKIQQVVERISRHDGADFYQSICLALGEVTLADYVFLAKIDQIELKATTLAVAYQDKILNNFSYLLAGTPCNVLAGNELCSHQSNVQALYPDDILLQDMNIEGYVGIPIAAPSGKVEAILVALFETEIADQQPIRALFLLFSGLIKKELEKKKLFEQLQLTNRVIQNSKDAVAICDKHAKIIYVNRSFSSITGYSLEDVLGRNPRILGANKQPPEFYKKMWHEILHHGGWQGEIWNKRKNGSIFPEWLSISAIYDENNEISHFVSFFSDITESKRAEEKIVYQANFDLLTGLANRYLFMSTLQQALNVKQTQQLHLAVFVIDVDLFKEINDSLGHKLGDRLLVKVAQRLQGVISAHDLAARLTGDGFAVLLNNLNDYKEIDHLASEINAAFSFPIEIDQHIIPITVSFGISVAPFNDITAEGLLKKAEQAMVHAKKKQRGSFHYFTQEMQDKAMRRLKLKKELELALQNRRLSVVFQPIVTLKTRTVDKLEALVRWNNNGIWVSPFEFITLAEEFGLINDIGEFVLEQACQQVIELKALGFDHMTINVNRSIHEFSMQSADSNTWLEVIERHQLQPTDICFELTETVLAPEQSGNVEQLTRLQNAGSTIALDDFGTGYSSLSYLRRFPIDFLKIDREFIIEMTNNDDDKVLVATIIAMSKALGMRVVAEGVETKEQLVALELLDCDYIQGYYFSKPLTPEELPLFLKQFNY
ncbi:bifunctional diguanylate cyclase/phosphodiesterase [Psychrobium sp. 1_MG-2023]|uniref:putative bifunctional diguanylate cyclase/phosphodiesterase n=1 Tax=Psychrobium sp. 1_MG-2023 TaxID=3062624 RepID=UPI000C32719E|nr:GGDEF domain-containing phosphodiesterase [Psychrobium sp. 1_MG-2023]MDP2559655.1 EAL domain-containing protein [Psychrobium sp. 1_MG-2023]PKF59486.1 phosphodiesterase [Alteromonadales bacterium alter-6D02]